MKNKSVGVAKNFIYNLIYQMLIILLPLITTPYLSRILKSEGIGIFSYTCSIVTFFILFGSVGSSLYGQREIAYVSSDSKKLSIKFYELVIIRLVFLSISMLIFYFTFCINNQYSLYYKILLLEIIANIFDISWFFQGKEEFGKLVTRNSIVKILCLFLIFTCIHTERDLWKYFLIYVSADVLGNLATWLYLPKYLVKIDKKDLQFKKHIIPMLSLFLPQVAIQIYTVLDKTMIGIITNNMSEVGFYEQAQKITKAALSVITSLQVVMNSRIAILHASKKKMEIKNNMERSFNFTWLLGIPLSFGIVGISHGLVSWYYGPGYEPVELILVVISPIILAIGFSSVIGVQYLVQVGKIKEFTKAIILGCITNFVLNIILIKHLNSTGAAIASVVAETVVFLVQLWYLKDDYSDLSILKGSYKPIIAGVLMLLIVKYLDLSLNVSIMSTILEIIFGAVVYLGLLILFKYKLLLDIINQIYVAIRDFMKRRKASEKNIDI